MEPFFHTRELYKTFGGVLATSGVNLKIEEKGLLSIIGPNGAGKTTLVNLITGRIPVTSGKVVYKGKDITNRPSHERVKMGICRTFQITSVFLSLSVFENVRIAKQAKNGGSLKILSSRGSLKQVNEKAWMLLEQMGLADKARVPAKNLAYGDQRVLEVAIGLAGDPRILFLDEPTAGMSPAETNGTARLIRGLAEDLSIVLIEHDMDVVMSISDKITVMHYGTIIAEGTPKEIQANDQVREAYLGKEE